MSELVILRGISGSGKSTYVEKHFIPKGYTHLEADMYFIRDGVYQFDRNKLGSAHKWCQTMTKQALNAGKNVVVSNTSTTLKELNDYIKIAEDCKVPFRVIRLAKQFQNIHNVPAEVVEAMKNRFQDYPGELVLTDY